jgi:hypothetical protein
MVDVYLSQSSVALFEATLRNKSCCLTYGRNGKLMYFTITTSFKNRIIYFPFAFLITRDQNLYHSRKFAIYS